jgi:hypothetical protein
MVILRYEDVKLKERGDTEIYYYISNSLKAEYVHFHHQRNVRRV